MGTMGFTAADRDAVRQALIDLSTGKRVVSIEVGGKNRTYGYSKIGELKELLAFILQDLNGATNWNKAKFNAPT